MSSASARPTTPEGPGSVIAAPNLPVGFAETFTSRYTDSRGRLRRADEHSAILIAASIFLEIFNVFLLFVELFGGRE